MLRLDFLVPQFDSREEAVRNMHLFVGPLLPGNLVGQKELVRYEEPGFFAVLVSADYKTTSEVRHGEVALAAQELWKGWFWVGGFDLDSAFHDYTIGSHVAFSAKDSPDTGALLLAGRASSDVAQVTFEFSYGDPSTASCRRERFVVATARRRLVECAARAPDGRVLARLKPEGWLAEIPDPPSGPFWSFTVGTEFEAEAEGEDERD